MSEVNEEQTHRHFSVACFNEVWRLLEMADRSEEDSRLMREMAHASLFHWMRRDDCAPTNLSIGLWQVSRVCAVLRHGEEASRYAQECIDLSKAHDLPPFYLGYAFEAAARAARVLERDEECGRFRDLAEEQLGKVEDEEERELLEADLRDLAAT